MTVPTGRRLAGWLDGAGPAGRAWLGAAAFGTLGAGVLSGWLAARGWPAIRAVPGTGGGDAVLLAAMAVALAAGNGYAKAYSP